MSVYVSDTLHVLFHGMVLGEAQELTLFSQCQTNAVTALTEWNNLSGTIATLGSPVSQPNYTAIADLPAGTSINGTTLAKRLVLIGLSEYSTAYLTQDGLRLVENAVYYLLGKTTPDRTTEIVSPEMNTVKAKKILTPAGIRILRGGRMYTLMGQAL